MLKLVTGILYLIPDVVMADSIISNHMLPHGGADFTCQKIPCSVLAFDACSALIMVTCIYEVHKCKNQPFHLHTIPGSTVQ